MCHILKKPVNVVYILNLIKTVGFHLLRLTKALVLINILGLDFVYYFKRKKKYSHIMNIYKFVRKGLEFATHKLMDHYDYFVVSSCLNY